MLSDCGDLPEASPKSADPGVAELMGYRTSTYPYMMRPDWSNHFSKYAKNRFELVETSYVDAGPGLPSYLLSLAELLQYKPVDYPVVL